MKRTGDGRQGRGTMRQLTMRMENERKGAIERGRERKREGAIERGRERSERG